MSMDVFDRLQDESEKLDALRRPATRICVRCGEALSDTIRRRDPDAIDCDGTCAKIAGGERDEEKHGR